MGDDDVEDEDAQEDHDDQGWSDAADQDDGEAGAAATCRSRVPMKTRFSSITRVNGNG